MQSIFYIHIRQDIYKLQLFHNYDKRERILLYYFKKENYVRLLATLKLFIVIYI